MRKKTTRIIVAAIATLGLALTLAPAAAAASPVATAPLALPATKNTPCTTAKTFGSGGFARVVPTTSGGSRDCYLVTGNQGNGVKALQRMLQHCEGYPVGKSGIDGIFGPATRSALTAFQRSYSLILDVDGVYGNQVHNFSKFRSNTGGNVWWCNRSTAIR